MSRTFFPFLAATVFVCPLFSARAKPLPPPPNNLPIGRWTIDFANGVKEACEVHKDGTASVVEPAAVVYR